MSTSEPAACVCIRPAAILDIFPGIPQTVTRETPFLAQCAIVNPTKSPIWMNASSGRSGRSAIANFSLREGMPVGVSVTLRRGRMYEFLDRLISAAIPRVRDFRGLPTRSFDGRGNYTLGVKEQIIFPEIEYDSVEKVHGMDITVVTSTDKDAEAYALLREMGFPFRGETTPTPILA